MAEYKFQSQQLDATVEGVSFIMETSKTFEGKLYTFKYKFIYDGLRMRDVFNLANRDAVSNENNSIKLLDESDPKNGETNKVKNTATRALLTKMVKQGITDVKLADKSRKSSVTIDDFINAADDKEIERIKKLIADYEAGQAGAIVK